jgi:hypothetical protein
VRRPPRRGERHLQALGHARGDLVLHAEHVGQRAVEALLPAHRRRRPAGDVDQLGGDADLPLAAGAARAPHAADEEVAHAELAGDLAR